MPLWKVRSYAFNRSHLNVRYQGAHQGCHERSCAKNAMSEGISQWYPNPNPDRTWQSKVGGIFSNAKSYAVIISLTQYIGTQNGGYRPLQTATQNAEKMKEFLLHDQGFDRVFVLTEDKVTKESIDHLIWDELKTLVTENDRFLLYWAGHGDQIMGRTQPIGLLPLLKSKSQQPSTMVSMNDLVRWSYLHLRAVANSLVVRGTRSTDLARC
jgi:hypothetical protein